MTCVQIHEVKAFILDFVHQPLLGASRGLTDAGFHQPLANAMPEAIKNRKLCSYKDLGLSTVPGNKLDRLCLDI